MQTKWDAYSWEYLAYRTLGPQIATRDLAYCRLLRQRCALYARRPEILDMRPCDIEQSNIAPGQAERRRDHSSIRKQVCMYRSCQLCMSPSLKDLGPLELVAQEIFARRPREHLISLQGKII